MRARAAQQRRIENSKRIKTMAANLEILAYEETPLGILCLRKRRSLSDPRTIVTEITLDNEFLMSSLNTISERALAEHAIHMHKGKDLQVLVGGLGLGYTAHEALSSSQVVAVEVVEFLPQVIAWLEAGLVPLADELRGESRLSVTKGDIFKRLAAEPGEKYDLILIDVDHSPKERLDPENARFYTIPGLQKAREHLAPGGILALWSYAGDRAFQTALSEVFDEVKIEHVTFENPLINDEKHTDWLFFARSENTTAR
jgi:spermidine synthase